jgi:hypothetical protein
MVYFSKQTSHFWVNFGGSCNGRCWSILRSFGIFCGHLVHFMVIWFIFSPFWCVVPRKIWQPCLSNHNRRPVLEPLVVES